MTSLSNQDLPAENNRIAHGSASGEVTLLASKGGLLLPNLDTLPFDKKAVQFLKKYKKDSETARILLKNHYRFLQKQKALCH